MKNYEVKPVDGDINCWHRSYIVSSALFKSEIVITSFPKPRLISIKFRIEFDKAVTRSLCCLVLMKIPVLLR